MLRQATIRPSFPLTAFLLGFLLLPACRTTADPAPAFVAETVYDGATTIVSMDCGELNSAHGGPEIAMLTSDGRVRIITPGTATWSAVLISSDGDSSSTPYSRPTISVGDLDPSVAGDEIASLSNQHLNVATCVWGDFWETRKIYDSEGTYNGNWGARIGDYMPSHPGNEIFMIYEGALDNSSARSYYLVNGAWSYDIVYNGEVGMDSTAGELDSSHPGYEVIITTEMGPTYQIWEEPLPPDNFWAGFILWDDLEHAGWVCEMADVDEISTGPEVVFGTRYSNSILVSHAFESGQALVELIFTGQAEGPTMNMTDIATGDIIPASEVMEIVGVDDSGRLYLVRRDLGSWVGETIWTDTEGPLYAVVVADFKPEYPGQEIVVASASGKLTMLHQQDVSPVPPASNLMTTLRATLSNYPNPFNPETAIRFELTEAANVDLTVHDLAGKLIRRLGIGHLDPGSHLYTWDGNDGSGNPMASGGYCYRLTVRGQSLEGRMTLVK